LTMFFVTWTGTTARFSPLGMLYGSQCKGLILSELKEKSVALYHMFIPYAFKSTVRKRAVCIQKAFFLIDPARDIVRISALLSMDLSLESIIQEGLQCYLWLRFPNEDFVSVINILESPVDSLHQVNAEPLVLLEWGSVLGLPALRWSYTVMTMAIYDNTAGQVYLVDMTGRGYADTCGKSLAATVDDKRWPEWADEDVAKAYKFYLLRTMDFAASNHELQNFINKAAQTFYCESILHGLVSYADENLTTTCHLMYPDHFARKQIAKANEILQKEMAEYWKQFMGELVDEMEAVYLTERQFVDVRNRIKCRVSEGALRFTESSMNNISGICRTSFTTITESGDRLLKYLESVNELLSHNGQQHHDNVSSIGAGG
uniref:Nuclear pore complex protein n=1 Tax=Angiostrongylus cantonensis TaxID=6313 RepID=A0A158P704_ANGCA